MIRIPLLAASFLAACLLLLTSTSTSAEGEGALLGFPQVRCEGATATVTFEWLALVTGTEQWLDLSTQDNGFASETFIAAGPMTPASISFAWSGILTETPHFWRINVLTTEGWMTSVTGAFVPCGAPALRSAVADCDDGGAMTVHFRWAPSAPGASQQWLDVSKFDNEFLPNTFTGMGPLASFINTYSLPGLLAVNTYTFRVNALIGGVWRTSQPVMLDADC